MEDIVVVNPTYKALSFLVTYGDWVAAAAALAPVLCGIFAWAAMGLHLGYVMGGAVIGAFLYLIMRSYVELVRVIVDMLLPK